MSALTPLEALKADVARLEARVEEHTDAVNRNSSLVKALVESTIRLQNTLADYLTQTAELIRLWRAR